MLFPDAGSDSLCEAESECRAARRLTVTKDLKIERKKENYTQYTLHRLLPTNI